jgi:anhydro-N-acetylmuramic acid kinase
MMHPFFRRTPPRSTGREEFGDLFLRDLLRYGSQLSKADLIATASFLTPLAVHEAYTRFIGRKMRVDELIVSGGGAKNAYFIRVLEILFGKGVVKRSEKFGMPVEAKEALCFAVLAHEAVAGNPANIPSVTGARKSVVLGKVCRGEKP